MTLLNDSLSNSSPMALLLLLVLIAVGMGSYRTSHDSTRIVHIKFIGHITVCPPPDENPNLRNWFSSGWWNRVWPFVVPFFRVVDLYWEDTSCRSWDTSLILASYLFRWARGCLHFVPILWLAASRMTTPELLDSFKLGIGESIF